MENSDTSHYCNAGRPQVTTCNLNVVTGDSVIVGATLEACETLVVGDSFTAEAGAAATLSAGILSNDVVSATESYQGCPSVKIGPAWTVESPGDVTVTADDWIFIDGEFSIEIGARFRASAGH